jgi:hypothetical protein
MSELGDGPIEPGYVRQMNDIARALDGAFNGDTKGGIDRKTGFVLLVFPFGSTGRANYISNGADRTDIVRLFREQIRRFEGE